MDIFDRITVFNNVIKIKKLAQTAEFKNLTQNLPQPSLNPENISAAQQIEHTFGLIPNLETRDPVALKNQLTNLGKSIGRVFHSLTQRLDRPGISENERQKIETEIRGATESLSANMKRNPILSRPDLITYLSEGSKDGSDRQFGFGGFDYFAPFKTQSPPSRQPNSAAPAAPQQQLQHSEFDSNLALGDISRAQKNAREYIYSINNTPGEAGKKFYATRLSNYVVSPMIMLYDKAVSLQNQAIAKQIESLFGTLDQQLLDQNPTLLDQELASRVSQIASKSYA